MFSILLAICIILITILWLLVRKPNHPVDKLPGPSTYPLLGTVPHFCVPPIEIFKKFNKLAETHKTIYRTWQTKFNPTIHPLHAKYLEPVLSSSLHIKKSFIYTFLAEWLGYGLLITDGAKWFSRRKLLTPAFHFTILEQFLEIFNKQTKILVEKLENYVNKEEGVDIVPMITNCTLDVICESAMGYNLNSQNHAAKEYVDALHEVGEILKYRVRRPWLFPTWIFHRTEVGRKHLACLKILHGFTTKVINERRQILEQSNAEVKDKNVENPDDIYIGGKKIRPAFLDLLLRESKKDPTLTDSEIRSEVDTFMFAGHDTTAMAISWTLYHLSVHQEIQEKCYNEINNIFTSDDEDVTMSKLSSMKYLEQVIKESLRLNPPIPKVSRHLKHDLNLGDLGIFPPETHVDLFIYNIHRNPEFFNDPDKFDPERFSPENIQGRHPYAYIPFSAGPRNCIGQKFAMNEIKTVVSTILRNFRLESCDPEKYGEVAPDIALRPNNGIVTRFYKRNTAN